MLTTRPITKLVFLDIESKALWDTFEDAPAKTKLLFSRQWDWLIEQIAHRHYLDSVLTDKKKADHELSYSKAQDEVWRDKAHLSPETAQIICISAGMIVENEDKSLSFRCASFTGETDKEILTAFLANKKSFIHEKDSSSSDKNVVCYNALGFDIPFLSRRILYNGLELPDRLQISGLKPWNIYSIIDLKDSIKFGGFDAPSLETLCTMFNVETAQDKFQTEASELAGKHKDKQYDVIKHYCEQDVFAIAQVYLKLIRSKEHPTGINQQLTKI